MTFIAIISVVVSTLIVPKVPPTHKRSCFSDSEQDVFFFYNLLKISRKQRARGKSHIKSSCIFSVKNNWCDLTLWCSLGWVAWPLAMDNFRLLRIFFRHFNMGQGKSQKNRIRLNKYINESNKHTWTWNNL